MAFFPYSPLALGAHARPGNPVGEIAQELGAHPTQVALAWLLHRAPNVLPIPSTSSFHHLEQNVAAAAIALSPEQFLRIASATSGLSGARNAV